MRLTSAAPVATLTRPTEPQSVAAPKPAVAAPTAQGVQGVLPDKCGTPVPGIVAGGCSPGPSLPGIPLPPFPGKPSPDAATRNKQADQLHQIGHGVGTGQLTKQETETLLKEQEAISNYQRQAMADGNLSLGERLKLGMMQSRAEYNIHVARNNFSRDVFASHDMTAQTQAHQIHQIANGRETGNITNSESAKLLGQQAEVADARQSRGPFTNILTHIKQNEAQKDIHLHNKPGTQIDFGDFKPLPRPFPLF
jgi:hypothetical protein